MSFKEFGASIVACVTSVALVAGFIHVSALHGTLERTEASGRKLLSSNTITLAESQPRLATDVVASRMAQPYQMGATIPPLGNTVSRSYASALEYDVERLWQIGIELNPHNSRVKKNCTGSSGNEFVSGLAIQAGVRYETCHNGLPIIPDSYQRANKCVVHFDASVEAQAASQGNTIAVLGHEIAHCLYFVYGEENGIDDDYLAIRPEAARLGTHERSEVFADDFIRCEHGLNTNWGTHSYYAQFDVSAPTTRQCVALNTLYDAYFPL